MNVKWKYLYIYHTICTQILQIIQEKTKWDIVIMYVCNLNNLLCEDGNRIYMQDIY